jgi:Asp-tRNA(Asn)/Glu-tRNA(Gln) amidotransferase A subunit family amidase
VDFRRETVADLAAQVRAGQLASRELVQHALDRIEALNPDVNAFTEVHADEALAAAATLDDQVATGEEVGPLAGIPVGVKDLEDAAGYRTTYGSPAFERVALAQTDAEHVARLKQAGAIVVGKTNTPEVGHKADTRNAVWGTTRNPWSLDRSPGGSSGGSGAALAAGMVPLCTGSDGGGSIRIPAAVNGMSGFKPSLGRIPDGGARNTAWPDLSTKGPMALRVPDIALALDVVVGPDPRDIRSLPMPASAWLPQVLDPGAPLKVGWSPTLGYGSVDSEVHQLCEDALQVLEGLGTEVIEVPTVWDEDPVGHFLRISGAGSLRVLDEHRGTEVWERFDDTLRFGLDGAADLSAVELFHSLDAGHLLNLRLVEVFHEVDLLLSPTCAGQTPEADSIMGTVDGEPEINWVQNTYPFNLTRSPAGTVVAGLTADGMPVGLQVVGPQHADVAVLRLMHLLELAIGFDQVAPTGS